MRQTQYEVKLINKRDGVYTEFIIGKKVNIVTRNKLVKLIIAFSGEKIKETKRFEHYLVKGNKTTIAFIL